jgi:cbb3-type cytochrome oxidase subunit 3
MFILFYLLNLSPYKKKHKKNIDEDNYVTGERNRTFVPLET